ncbi:MAG: response regulator transcription factor [Ruminococcaceae bacterium]|nr:response regulator transcription factor [Oscillospiraceae bacterium]
MKKVLIVEDEKIIRDFVIINLKRSGYEVIEASSGEEGIELFNSNPDIDIAILDVMLPGIDGFTVCDTIRKKSNTVGIIILSAKAQEMDKVTGLMTGADDYIPKPFSPSELTARVDSLYRRVNIKSPQQKVDEILEDGPFSLNLRSRILLKNNIQKDLTQVEFLIMKLFMENSKKALSREEILDKVWGKEYFGELKIVDVNIRRLRMKIEDDPSVPKYIHTLWGYGYKWEV